MVKFKDAVKRASLLLGAAGLLVGVGASAIPAFVSADALNPLTDRSLSLSSSSPGWSYTDGSGNSTYAGPGTGTNGQKTGNTFSFRTSSDATVKAFTFQYCTEPAGDCTGPGDDASGNTDTDSTTDLNIVTSSPAEVNAGDYATLSADGTATGTSGNTATDTGSGTADTYGNVKENPAGQDTNDPYANNDLYTWDSGQPDNTIPGNFVVLVGNSATGYVNTYSGGWAMTTQDQQEAGDTGDQNMITLTNSTGVALHPGDYVKVFFFATDQNYITNPGAGAFFVKINDYNSDQYQNWEDNLPNAPVDGSTDYTCGAEDMGVLDPGNEDCAENDIDGGVTVANVMNQSIQIETKVLETMDFSVGVVDPDTLTPTELDAAGDASGHAACQSILPGMDPSDPANVLTMGNSGAENSLATDATYAADSFWRLSSNSSGGATVYYAGNTLSDTEGDQIAPINAAAPGTLLPPAVGNAQFGLALDNAGTYTPADYETVNGDTGSEYNPYLVDYGLAANDTRGTTPISDEYTAALTATSHGTALDTVGSNYEGNNDVANTASQSWSLYLTNNPGAAHEPELYPLAPEANYADGTGGINTWDGAVNTNFAFNPASQTVPTPVATESTQVVNCVTGKMRYVANIAATTPAGIYTTKINYIAAPQY